MTWTFSDLVVSTRDRLRFLVGDTDVNDQQLQDQALDFLLAEEGTIYAAAAAAARSIGALYARRVDFSNSTLSLAASQRVAHYSALALSFERRARAGSSGGGIGSPIVGGVSIAALNTFREDTDAVQNRARHDLHDGNYATTPAVVE